VIDFSDEKLSCTDNIKKALVGPEGGFSQEERELFEGLKVVGFDTELVLRSESAVVAVASKVVV
jgi:16S rRNA (uracil1498-N3)-methyltransferase